MLVPAPQQGNDGDAKRYKNFVNNCSNSTVHIVSIHASILNVALPVSQDLQAQANNHINAYTNRAASIEQERPGKIDKRSTLRETGRRL